MKSFKEHSKSLHGAIVSHHLTNHTMHVRKEKEKGHYGLYNNGKYIGGVTAENEAGAIRILRKRGYHIK